MRILGRERTHGSIGRRGLIGALGLGLIDFRAAEAACVAIALEVQAVAGRAGVEPQGIITGPAVVDAREGALGVG